MCRRGDPVLASELCSAPTLPVLTGTKFESNASDTNQTGAIDDNVGPGPRGTQACPTP
jgi:hypothetical protein